jgi:hypothetical protein
MESAAANQLNVGQETRATDSTTVLTDEKIDEKQFSSLPEWWAAG